MWTALIGPVSELAGTWLKGSVEKSKAKTEAKVAKAKAEATIMEKKAPVDRDWETGPIRAVHISYLPCF